MFGNAPLASHHQDGALVRYIEGGKVRPDHPAAGDVPTSLLAAKVLTAKPVDENV